MSREGWVNIGDGTTAPRMVMINADGTPINLLAGIDASADELNILDGATLTTAELNRLDGVPAAAGLVLLQEVLFTEDGEGTYTGTIALPEGNRILDLGVDGIALWDAATSASLVVGDDDDPDGFFLATDLKATDLLEGEINNIEHPGGLAGAYLAAEQRNLYSAAARNVIGVVTTVGAGTAGRTRLYAVYAVATALAAVKA